MLRNFASSKEDRMSKKLPAVPDSFEEFKKLVHSFPNTKGAIDKLGDAYSNIPPLLRVLSAFERTGVWAAVDRFLTEKREKRIQNNILLAMYELAKIGNSLGQKFAEMEISYREEQVPELTYMYFDHCRKTIQDDKIRYFRNVWFNSVIDTDRQLDEKAYVFDLVGSLRIEQILVLKYVHEKQANTKAKVRIAVEVKNIAEALAMKNEHVQQICISLQGMGFLHTGLGPRRQQGPNLFSMTEYVQLMGDYIKAPEIS